LLAALVDLEKELEDLDREFEVLQLKGAWPVQAQSRQWSL
jgi:hypothetical protein